ncbi:MAG: homoserine kinase [Ilumatobacteraceae bacterium]
MSGSFHVRVPASSANLGPGFDALGMALSLYLVAGVDGESSPLEGARVVDSHHPAQVAFAETGGTGSLWVASRIPMGRGLGFSGAARVAGVVASHAQRNGIGATSFDSAKRSILHLTTAMEGHPDNVAASLYGGVTASASGEVVCLPLGVDPAIVAWVPETQTSTEKSRTSIPAQIALKDVIFNIGHTALVMGALASGDTSVMRAAFTDRLHQDVRLAAAPTSKAALEAALSTSAWAAWLSGSGPTVAVMCDRAEAASIAAQLPTDGTTHVLEIDASGAVLSAS